MAESARTQLSSFDYELLMTAGCLTVFILAAKAIVCRSSCSPGIARGITTALLVLQILTAVTICCLASHWLAAVVLLLMPIAGESLLAVALQWWRATEERVSSHRSATELNPTVPTSVNVEGHIEPQRSQVLNGDALLGVAPIGFANQESHYEFEEDEENEEAFPENCLQSVQRFSSDSGEMVSGRAVACFEPGQRFQTIHVAFCPPLPSIPEAEVFQTSGPEVDVKKTLVEKFGLRLDVKASRAALSSFDSNASNSDPQSAESCSLAGQNVEIEFIARCDRAG